MFNVDKLRYIDKNGYSGSPACGFNTKIFDLEHKITKILKKYLKWLINKIDPRAAHALYMDDGSINILKSSNKNKFNANIRIHSNNFDYKTHLLFVEKFKTWGINPKICKSKDKYYYLSFNLENSKLLIKLISKYIHPSMIYKIKNPYLDEKITLYKWSNKFMDWGTLKVNDIKYIDNTGYGKSKKPRVYDIEVEDNHNFIVTSRHSKYQDGIICSNCHHLSPNVFSRALPQNRLQIYVWIVCYSNKR